MKWSIKPVLVLLLTVLTGRFSVMGPAQDAVDSLLKSFLPSDVRGWKAETKDAVYDRESIFEYIDGAGEVYRAYNFRRLLSRRFVRDGRPDLVADLFDMGASYDAFGVFSNDLEGEEAGLGQGSTYNGGLLAFWKDRYFVSLSADRETEETKAALFSLGRSIAASIEQEGPKPPLLALLPSEFAEAKAVRYLHNHIILNRHFFVSHDDILGLGRADGAVLSKPGKKGETGVLLLVEYPTAKTASDVYVDFSRVYMPDAKEPGSVQTEDKTWTATALRGKLLAVVFHAPSEAAAKDVLSRIKSGVK
jgi:hypothetical protein